MMSQSYDDLDLRKYRRVLDNEMLRSVDDTVLYCSKNIDLKKYDEIVDLSIALLPLASVCSNCAKLTVFRCKKCNSAFYCSRLCQRKSWDTHKIVCGMSSVSIQSETDVKMNIDQSAVSYSNCDVEISSRIKRRFDESNADQSSYSNLADSSVQATSSNSGILQWNSSKRLLGIEEVDEETQGEDESIADKRSHHHSHREALAEECMPCVPAAETTSSRSSYDDEGVATLMSLLGSTEKDARYALQLYKNVDAAANWLISKDETCALSNCVSPERSYATVAGSLPLLPPSFVHMPERPSLFSSSTQDVSWMGLDQQSLSFRPVDSQQQQQPPPLIKQEYQHEHKLDAPANMTPLFSNNETDDFSESNSFGFTTPPRNSNSYLKESQSIIGDATNPFSVNTGSTSTRIPFSGLWKDEVETRAKQKREKSAAMLCEALGISFAVAMSALDRCDGDSDRAAEWVLTAACSNPGGGQYSSKTTNFDSID